MTAPVLYDMTERRTDNAQVQGSEGYEARRSSREAAPANRLDHLVRANPSLAVAIIRDLTS
jgi:hypothetical protein